MSAVTEKRDKNGRQYLTGYYTADGFIDEKQLRSSLSKRLPKYMVPNFLIRLEEIPVTSSGKTDRKNLPEPDISSDSFEYIPLRNE